MAHLQSNFHQGTAWHRNQERVARGVPPVTTAATQLVGWERELVWTEILLLTGHPHTVFRHLARAWGRDKGFHRVLAQFICQRQGSVERKNQLGRETTQCVAVSGGDSSSRSTTMRTTHAAAANAAHPDATITALQEPGPLAAAVAAEPSDHTAANIWDSACYYGMEYNEALAATLLDCVAPEDVGDAAVPLVHNDDDDEGDDDTAS